MHGVDVSIDGQQKMIQTSESKIRHRPMVWWQKKRPELLLPFVLHVDCVWFDVSTYEKHD